jgi:hypothetical protein
MDASIPGQSMGEIVLYGAFLVPPFLGLLIAMSVLMPTWRWVVGGIFALFIGLGGIWALLLAGFQPRDMGVYMGKQYLAFITSSAVVGTVIFGLAMAWYYERTHEN